MASLGKRDDKKKTRLRANKQSTVQKNDPKPGSSGSKPSKSLITNFLKVLSKKQIDQNGDKNEFHLNVTPQSKKIDAENAALRASNKLACKRKQAFPKLRGSYHLRSLDSGRVLRSRPSTTKCNSLLIPVSTRENLVPRPKKRGKKNVTKSDQDELSRIKKHIRYMLTRMNYEQSLIDAYSGEGWKGQSAEKIRPEKELGRAKSEILRCKLKIRAIFQHLDSLLAEGRLQESLFDADGIDSENIFCGKCSSKEVSIENDIILCDGICERGFHQNCLNPPLLSEDIPSGDEGWLCPECDCKLESIDLLNEYLENDISFEDSWERIFPEAAGLANGNGHHDLNLPSDDSEDDDDNPAQRVGVNEQVERSGCEESDASSSSGDSTSSEDNTGKLAQATVELSTDDSEDEDYDPDSINPDKEIQKTKSSSDESDFTSDSDEFCTELRKKSNVGEASASSPPILEFCNDSVRENMTDQDMPLDDSEFLSPMLEVEKLGSGLRSSNKRDRERLDYKKLYEEAYGTSSSDSSDDEDWSEQSTPKKSMKIDDEEIEEDSLLTVAKTTQNLKKGISSISEKEHVLRESHSSSYSSIHQRKYGIANKKKLYEAFRENQYPTTEEKQSLALELGMTLQQVTKWFGNARHSSRIAASTPPKATHSIRTAEEKPYKKKLNKAFQESHYPSKGKKEELAQELGMTSRQKKLYETFRENQYPTTEEKKSLAQELGMTLKQVTKWFGNARHSSRIAASTPPKATHSVRTAEEKKKLNMAFQESHFPSKGKKEELAQELGMTFRQVSKWFDTARRNFRISSKKSSDRSTFCSDKVEAADNDMHDIGAPDMIPGEFTPDKATMTASTSNSSPNCLEDRIMLNDNSRDEVATFAGCTSFTKPEKGIVLESPGIPRTDKVASIDMGEKSPVVTSPKSELKGSIEGKGEEDDRQKAIAKELRRMRAGR